MRSFEHLVGSFLLTLSLIFCTSAYATEYEYEPALYHEYDWLEIGKWTGLGALAILGITQFDKSELLFAGAYGLVGVYYVQEVIAEDSPFLFEDYVIPAGMAAMALANLTLLTQDEESKSTIFAVNFVGSFLFATYWYYYNGPGKRASLTPWSNGQSNGIAFNFNF